MLQDRENWFVVQTLSGDEKKLQEVSSCCGSAETFVPLREIVQRRNGKYIKRTLPLFSGYVFVHNHVDAFLMAVKQSDFDVVAKPLRMGNSHLKVAPKEMEFISRLTGQGVVGVSVGYINDDGKLHIVKGPMKDMEGNILFFDKRKKKAKVEFELFQRKLEVTLGLEIIDQQSSIEQNSNI